MKDTKLTQSNQLEYEEPMLLGADDLMDVAGGCIASCSNGDCKPSIQPNR